MKWSCNINANAAKVQIANAADFDLLPKLVALDTAFATFEYVRKLAINSYDHQAIEITQQHSVDATGSGRIKTSFGIESPSVACIQTYQHEMAHNGFQVVLKTE